MPQPFTEEELRSSDPSRFTETRRVRFQDVDAAGIIFYPRVLEYFSDAYMSWLQEAGIDIPRTLELGEIGFPLVRAEAEYLRPLRFGDVIAVEIAAAQGRRDVVHDRLPDPHGHGPPGVDRADGARVHRSRDIPRVLDPGRAPEPARRLTDPSGARRSVSARRPGPARRTRRHSAALRARRARACPSR